MVPTFRCEGYFWSRLLDVRGTFVRDTFTYTPVLTFKLTLNLTLILTLIFSLYIILYSPYFNLPSLT